MTLLPLSPYSPEVNSVEHIWTCVRTNDRRHQPFDNLNATVDTVSPSLHTPASTQLSSTP